MPATLLSSEEVAVTPLVLVRTPGVHFSTGSPVWPARVRISAARRTSWRALMNMVTIATWRPSCSRVTIRIGLPLAVSLVISPPVGA